MKRLIILSKSMGVYLGHTVGLGFWSKLDPVGQPCAPTFESQDAISECMLGWDGLASLPSDFTYPEVEPDDDTYASMAACVAAGAEPWKHQSKLESMLDAIIATVQPSGVGIHKLPGGGYEINLN